MQHDNGVGMDETLDIDTHMQHDNGVGVDEAYRLTCSMTMGSAWTRQYTHMQHDNGVGVDEANKPEQQAAVAVDVFRRLLFEFQARNLLES